ncbi:DUF5776 domain-containing protein [Levilactobacillus hammesii]|uniref:DUF5776 domain-containing protein n=1 Tax=Levilactobacillus hammesii DSM 16381 TaxID=1423753 RepID=A0A0R1UYB0_9LACO|nr:DUF5776 domain-containing protein [Levilactobacillus hammesii]KRL98287.1 hypothetical protein FD28_GL000086 [Levilactobacillus hammesii DSM 16381]
MTWKIGLMALGMTLGLSPLFGLNNQPSSPTLQTPVVALADTTANESYSGVIGSGDTTVPWTLQNGTLTLKGGTIPPFSGPIFQIGNGQLLTALQKGNTDNLTMADFANKVSTIDFAGKVVANANSTSLFARFSNVTSYRHLENLDLSLVTNMSGIFSSNTSLRTFTAPTFADDHPHTLANMFGADTALTYLDLSNLDSQHVTDVSGLAGSCTSLQVLNLANFSAPLRNDPTKYTDLVTASRSLADITVNDNVVLSGLNLTLTTASLQDIDGQAWQEVGPGKVTLLNQTPNADFTDTKANYSNYDPQGDTITGYSQLFAMYNGHDDVVTGNRHYVLKPVDSGTARFTTPDPTPSVPSIPTVKPDTAQFDPFTVMATQKIGLYSGKNFSTANRLAWFAKKPQMKQPTFTVIGTDTSTAGHARYHVRDTNPASSTDGQTGYITANAAYVTHTYYQSAPPVVTVINPGGVKGYGTAALTQPQTAYRQGAQLTVRKVVTHNQTTRFLLNNGHYVSANKHFVTLGKQRVPAKVRAKTAVNRYDTVNLSQKNHHYARQSHHVFKVLGWDYSYGTTTTLSGTLRYRVAGGYITANHQLVQEQP